MSIAEVIDLQLVQNRLHAVGAYQMARPINSIVGWASLPTIIDN